MAQALFYDSVHNDRLYNANSFQHLVRALFNSGVSKYGDQMAVTAAGGMQVRVAGGLVNCDGKIGVFDEETLTIDTAPTGNNYRWDLIVARRDDSNRVIALAVRKGENNTEPALDENEIEIARIKVESGVSQIVDSKIVRDHVVWLTERVEEDKLAGFQTQFNDWLANLRALLVNSNDEPVGLAQAISEINDALTGTNGVNARLNTLEGKVLPLEDNSGGLSMTPLWRLPGFANDQAIDDAASATQYGAQTVLATGVDLSQYPAVLIEFRKFGLFYADKTNKYAKDAAKRALVHERDRIFLFLWAGTSGCASGVNYNDSNKSFTRHVSYSQSAGIAFSQVRYDKNAEGKALGIFKNVVNNSAVNITADCCLLPLAIYGVSGVSPYFGANA